MIKLDHAVYFASKTPEEIVVEQKSEGKHAVIGGSHLQWGSYNALMYLKNAYIEWIAVENQEIAEKTKHPLIEQLLLDDEGWGTICLAVEDLEALHKRITSKGIRSSGILKSERKTVDGKIRKWRMLNIEQQISDTLPLPLLIEWDDKDDKRYEILRADGSISSSSEQFEVKECVFSVEYPVETAEKWANLFSLERSGSRLILPNATLNFIQKVNEMDKERLSDVLIGKA
ncbi:VOC family protein [Sporosarcina siberiensis]|uniref:VOC family protein n=1 Tax=Sporosarcina siberiensis TaxID=1365606 RepID=A0ABW4SDQ0_9BACL